MKLEEIFDVVKKEGVEQWDIASLNGPLDFWGVMIDNKQIAKELKKMYRNDRKSLNLLYEKINAPLIVLEKYEGKQRLSNLNLIYYSKDGIEEHIDMDDMLGAKVYMLLKNRTVTFKKTDEYPIYIYKVFQKDVSSEGFNCLHEGECPVSYLNKWHKKDYLD